VDKVERQQIKRVEVDDHHLPVISNQVVCRAHDRNASLQKTHFQTTQALRTALVSVSNQRADGNTPADGCFQGRLQLLPIHAEDQDVNALLRALDCCKKWRDAIVGLYQQFHNPFSGLPGSFVMDDILTLSFNTDRETGGTGSRPPCYLSHMSVPSVLIENNYNVPRFEDADYPPRRLNEPTP
jgi:hypothetical protein